MKQIYRSLIGTTAFLWIYALPTQAQPLIPDKADTFFVTPGEETTIVWKVEPKADGAKQRTYRISDYSGKTVAQGDASIENGKLLVKTNLSRGYYDIEVSGETFGIVSQNAYAGKPDAFFGMDAVLNWLDRRPEMRQVMVRDMKRSGIAMARERINWNQVEPKPGEWNWAESDQAWALRQIYQKEGMPVLEMFHSPGPARGPFPVKSSYPQNLAVLSQAWPVIYGQFKSTWGGLEVWNEPEGPYGSHLPADQYVMLVKAMRYTLQKNKIAAPLGGGVFIGGDPGLFHQFCASNGMLDDVDFVSLHDYKPATKMERLLRVHRAWLKEGAHEGMPLWVTECGWSWPKAGGRPPLDKDRESALEIAMKGVEAKACGVVRYMPFCLPFYEENGANSFSMMGKDVTPLRSMGAYAQSIRVLAGKNYVGDLPVDDKAILRARVFEGSAESDADGGRVIVFYTDVVGDDQKITIPIKASRVEGIDGRALAQDADGKVPIPDGMVYVWSGQGKINRQTKAMALLKTSQRKTGGSGIVSPIVLQYLVDPAHVNFSSTCYLINQDTAAALEVKVRVHNLAANAQKLTLRLALSGEKPKVASTREKTVEVPALGVTDVAWSVDGGGKWKSPEALPITVTGNLEGGKAISPLSIPMQVEGELETWLPAYSRKDNLEIGDLSRWSDNITKNGKMQREKIAGGGLKMSVQFGTGDRWNYPKFKLAPGTVSRTSGFLLRARVEKPADVRMALYKKDGTAFITADPLIPADGKWHVVYVPFRSFETDQAIANKSDGDCKPEEIEALSVGINDRSTERTNVLEVDRLILVGSGN